MAIRYGIVGSQGEDKDIADEGEGEARSGDSEVAEIGGRAVTEVGVGEIFGGCVGDDHGGRIVGTEPHWAHAR